MSKKRKSVECSYEERTTEDSEAILRQTENAKHGKFASSSETTLQDLPMEMLECILVKVVAMEVKGMKFSKSVWKEKANLVISRLRTVATQWNNILTTNFFRNELHRTLEGIAQETIRLEMSDRPLMQSVIIDVAAMKDEIFIHSTTPDRGNAINEIYPCSFDIKVYDRNNMKKVKYVIPLCKRGICGALIAACSLTNCLYVEDQGRQTFNSSIVRFTRYKKRKFNRHTLFTHLPFRINSMSVSVNGSLLFLSRLNRLDHDAASVYDVNGLMQHQVLLSPDINGLILVDSVVQKPNGNLVIASASEKSKLILTEIGTDGDIKCQCESPLGSRSYVAVADSFGRIVIIDAINGIQLLDSEFNLVACSRPQLIQEDFHSQLHDDGEINQVVGFHLTGMDYSILSIYRFGNK